MSASEEVQPAGSVTRLVAAIAPLLVGAAALINSFLLGVGTLSAPGAGLWPAGASAVMVIASGLLLARWRVLNADCERYDKRVLQIGLGVASLGVFVVLFGGISAIGWSGIGFEWATAALLVFWLRVLGRERWLTTVAVTLAITVALHLFFIEFFKAPLPHMIGF